ncbi:PHB depolymerase family esterase [Micromonospora sp. NPDC007220]|uniref:PHB depolymerase family esterase n=1 Tax=Micromonospora sp. NPDC007220 TaxID=3154318 RepID=UPI00340F9E2B
MRRTVAVLTGCSSPSSPRRAVGTGVSPGSRRPRRLRGPSSAPPPATTGSPWRTAGPTAGTCCGTTDDVGFLKDLTAHLVRTWRADPDRVYLIGISNGGDMSFRAAVEGERLFAAIGVVSGGYSGPRDVRAPATGLGDHLHRRAGPLRRRLHRGRTDLAATAALHAGDRRTAGGRATGHPHRAGQRRSSIRVLPRVFGLTRSRSRNSATPSSYERRSCS